MTHLEIRKNGNKKIGYIVRSYTVNGTKKRQYLRRATEEEIQEHLKSQKNKKELVNVSCSNPNCNKIFKIPKRQKQKFFTTHFLRYGQIVLPYCSNKCRDEHFKELNLKKTTPTKPENLRTI